MQQPVLTAADWTVVVVYMIVMMGVGVFARTLIKTPDDYFAAGRRMPWWLAAVSHHMSGYSAFAFVAFAAFAYRVGLTAWVVFSVPCAIGVGIGAFAWAPRWSRLKVLTPVEYLERRFNNLVRQVVAWSGIFLKFFDEGAKLFSLAVAVNVCTGLDIGYTIVGCGVIAVIYVMLGGLWASAISDFMQFVVQFGCTLILLPLVWMAVGGWSGLWAHPNAPPFRCTSADWPAERIFLYGIVVMLSYCGGTWGLAQRFYAIERPNDARKAALLSAGLYLVYPLAIFIPVWAAHIVLPPLEDPKQAYVLMTTEYLGPLLPGLIGLFLSAMFSATMSMVDSDINALAAVFTKDIYQRNFDPGSSDSKLLKVGLTATVVIGAMTVACGLLIMLPAFGGPFETMVKYFAGLLTPVSVPLLFGMLYRRATWRGAFAAWAGGLMAWALFEFWLHPCYTSQLYHGPGWVVSTGVEMVVSFGIFFLEGLVSEHTPEDKARVDALFDQLEGKGEAEEPQQQ